MTYIIPDVIDKTKDLFGKCADMDTDRDEIFIRFRIGEEPDSVVTEYIKGCSDGEPYLTRDVFDIVEITDYLNENNIVIGWPVQFEEGLHIIDNIDMYTQLLAMANSSMEMFRYSRQCREGKNPELPEKPEVTDSGEDDE